MANNYYSEYTPTALIAGVKSFLSQHQIINQPVALALSGGVDSMALLAALVALKIDVKPIIINHQLRPEMSAELNGITRFLNQQQLSCEVITWEHDGEIKGNIQAQARFHRYQLLTNYCQKQQLKVLLTAHHLDDQLENYLLRQERGSGTIGLGGISEELSINGIKVLRPLLKMPKISLHKLLALQQWPHWEDPSNHQQSYRRNYWRQHLATLSAVEKEQLAQTVDNKQRQAQALKAQIAQLEQALVSYNDQGLAKLDYASWVELHPDLQWQLLLAVGQRVSGRINHWRGVEITNLQQHLKATPTITTWHGCYWQRQGDAINCCREVAAIGADLVLQAKASAYWDQRWLVTNNTNEPVVVTHLPNFNNATWRVIKQQYHLHNSSYKRQYLSCPVVTLEKNLILPHIKSSTNEFEACWQPLNQWQL